MGKQNEKLLANMKKLDEVMDYKLIDNIEVDGIDTKDYPDFCDAYIVSADYDGKPMTDEQLDIINEDGDFQHECIMNDLH
tara:strand:+ start:3708 stop:3947 length:240 start_codon:yes stop_codon:yes gene_type:complete